MIEFAPLGMFMVACLALLAGYPVAFTLAGVGLLFAGIGMMTGGFDPLLLQALPNRIFGTMSNTTLSAVPLFVLMGVVLEKARIAENLLHHLGRLLQGLPGGLGMAVVGIGVLLAASTGIVGATVVTMGLIALPSLLRQGYSPSLASGLICATGTLGQIIPPSIALVLLGDILSSAHQQAQTAVGNFSPAPISVADLFAGALLPGLMLVLFYLGYLGIRIWWDGQTLSPEQKASAMPAQPVANSPPPVTRNTLDDPFSSEAPLASASAAPRELWPMLAALLAPILLILLVLGSILAGIATPTEAAGVGAMGAIALALLHRRLDLDCLRQSLYSTATITAMVFMILIGATIFSLVFAGYGGDELVTRLLHDLPGGKFTAMTLVMLVFFLLGFVLDFIEITFIVVPIVAPALLMMGFDPLWLGIMIALNLQTSFLTPPFGFALFYLRPVAPEAVTTSALYRGVAPFICIQLITLAILAWQPWLATWLPRVFYV